MVVRHGSGVVARESVVVLVNGVEVIMCGMYGWIICLYKKNYRWRLID